MKPVLSLIFTTLLSVIGAFSLSANASDYQKITKDYVEFLNQQHPGLNLWAHSRGVQAYQELEILDLELERTTLNPGAIFEIPMNALKELSCSKIVCGGGGGSCPTCYHSSMLPAAQW